MSAHQPLHPISPQRSSFFPPASSAIPNSPLTLAGMSSPPLEPHSHNDSGYPMSSSPAEEVLGTPEPASSPPKSRANGELGGQPKFPSHGGDHSPSPFCFSFANDHQLPFLGFSSPPSITNTSAAASASSSQSQSQSQPQTQGRPDRKRKISHPHPTAATSSLSLMNPSSTPISISSGWAQLCRTTKRAVELQKLRDMDRDRDSDRQRQVQRPAMGGARMMLPTSGGRGRGRKSLPAQISASSSASGRTEREMNVDEADDGDAGVESSMIRVEEGSRVAGAVGLGMGMGMAPGRKRPRFSLLTSHSHSHLHTPSTTSTNNNNPSSSSASPFTATVPPRIEPVAGAESETGSGSGSVSGSGLGMGLGVGLGGGSCRVEGNGTQMLDLDAGVEMGMGMDIDMDALAPPLLASRGDGFFPSTSTSANIHAASYPSTSIANIAADGQDHPAFNNNDEDMQGREGSGGRTRSSSSEVQGQGAGTEIVMEDVEMQVEANENGNGNGNGNGSSRARNRERSWSGSTFEILSPSERGSSHLSLPSPLPPHPTTKPNYSNDNDYNDEDIDIDIEYNAMNINVNARMRRGFGATRVGMEGMMRGMKMGKRVMRAQFSTTPTHPTPGAPVPYPHLFTSHTTHATHSVLPNPLHPTAITRDYSTVYACAYSNAAKFGSGTGWEQDPDSRGVSIVAMGTESGGVRLLDTGKTAVVDGGRLRDLGFGRMEDIPAEDRSNIRNNGKSDGNDAENQVRRISEGYYAPHDNAIFDLKWSPDDKYLMTASADQTTKIWDVSRIGGSYGEGGGAQGEGMVAHLMGHTSSVKTCTWYDHNVVATAGRDGNIHIYDLRFSSRNNASSTSAEITALSKKIKMPTGYVHRGLREGAEEGQVWPVITIKNAHADNGGKQVKGRSSSRSVTSIVALQANPAYIASGGSLNGVIKLWDLRIPNNRKTIPEPAFQSLDRTCETSKRSRGIICLTESPKNGMLYALSGDNRITAYDQTDLRVPLPITYSQPNKTARSFYHKMCISPCERYIASGSGQGAIYAWEVGHNARKPMGATGEAGDTVIDATEIGWNGHTREVGAIDWAQDQIMTCSDDYTNKVWRPNRAAYENIRNDPKDAAWKWAGYRDKDA